MSNIYGFFVRRPLLVNLMMAFSVVAGIAATGFMNFQTFPAIDLGIVNVTTFRPGSSSEDVELSITVPLEEEILEVDGIDKVVSSSMEGLSVITVRLDPDAEDTDEIIADLQKAVDRASAELPDDLPRKPLLEELSSTRVPVLEIHLSGAVSEESLRRTARQLEDALREVPGVAGIDKVGYRQREVRILLDPDRLQRLGISYGEIAEAIARRNVRDSGGSLESFVAEKKVLVVGQFDHPKQVEDVIVRATDPGNLVRVRDVADVVLDYEDWKVQLRADGNVGIALLPRKKAEADGLETARALREFTDQARRNLPPGVTLAVINDISRFTYDMLDVLRGNALVGFVLVFVVLLAFFHFRLAFWVAVGLPVAIAITFAIMPLCGLGIDVMTLTALILMLGMLVDDAIVTGESIYRQREAGLEPVAASVKGVLHVSRPVIVSATTTVLAFAPAAFLGGLDGKFLWTLPVMALLALGGSLIECQLMLPAHLAHGSQMPRPKRWFGRVQAFYDGIIHRLIAHRYRTIGAFLLISLLILVWGYAVIDFKLYPEVDVDTFFLKVELPEGASFDYTGEKVRELETLVREVVPGHDLLNVTIQVGHHDTDLYGAQEGRNPAWALVSVFMSPQGERETNSNEAIAVLRERARELKGYKSILIRPIEDTPVLGKPVEVEVIGNDESRHTLAEVLVEYLRGCDGVTEVWTSHRPGKDVVRLDLDHEVLASRGLAVADVTQAVRIAFDGAVIDELRTVEEKIEYRLQYRPHEQGKMETLRDLVMIQREGKPVPLRAVADFEVRPGEASIKHYFGERTTTVYADIDPSKTSTAQVNADLKGYVEERGLLASYDRLRLWFGGELEQQEEALGNVGVAFILCLVSIFFLLVVLFNSLTQPFLIMAVIPFGFTGVIAAYALQGIEMSMLAFIGILGLAGVLVNDSVVMIDHLNRRKEDQGGGVLSDNEVAHGAKERLRPVVITSVTTVAGLAPAAYGLAGANPFMTPIVMAITWGCSSGPSCRCYCCLVCLRPNRTSGGLSGPQGLQAPLRGVAELETVAEESRRVGCEDAHVVDEEPAETVEDGEDRVEAQPNPDGPAGPGRDVVEAALPQPSAVFEPGNATVPGQHGPGLAESWSRRMVVRWTVFEDRSDRRHSARSGS